MSDYKTGSYIIKSKKVWRCFKCGKSINVGNQSFVRVNEYGEERTRADGKKYKLKTYYRFHIDCARNLLSLNDYERNLLNNQKVQLNSTYGVKSTASEKNSSVDVILEGFENLGYKVAYMDSDSILLKKTGSSPCTS